MKCTVARAADAALALLFTAHCISLCLSLLCSPRLKCWWAASRLRADRESARRQDEEVRERAAELLICRASERRPSFACIAVAVLTVLLLAMHGCAVLFIVLVQLALLHLALLLLI